MRKSLKVLLKNKDMTRADRCEKKIFKWTNNIAILSYIYMLLSILFDIIFKFELFIFFKSGILEPWFVYLRILVTLCIDKYSIQIEPA